MMSVCGTLEGGRRARVLKVKLTNEDLYRSGGEIEVEGEMVEEIG